MLLAIFVEKKQQPLQGKLNAFDNMAGGGSGPFLSLLDYTIKNQLHLVVVHVMSEEVAVMDFFKRFVQIL